MDWSQFLMLIGSQAVLFFWSRSESRADYRSIRQLVEAIQAEMKDFHGRLCTVEERTKKKEEQPPKD